MSFVRVDRGDDGVVRVTLDRPERHNAFDDALIGGLCAVLEDLAADAGLRALVLTGAGRSFSAGADLDWMRRAAEYDEAANLADARELERLLRALDEFPRPTIARVNGAAIGGGVGLVAACDIAIAVQRAVFALSEVRLGLAPAVIAPFVVRAIGERRARRYFLTAERFTAGVAGELGLVHHVVPDDGLDAAVDETLAQLLEAGPAAAVAAKMLLRELRTASPDRASAYTAQLIADLRASPEGREGIRAFLEKRPPAWCRRP